MLGNNPFAHYLNDDYKYNKCYVLYKYHGNTGSDMSLIKEKNEHSIFYTIYSFVYHFSTHQKFIQIAR